MGITPGPPQIDEGADKKGPTYDIVGAETDALIMLNAALHGVDALQGAISLMEQAAGKIVVAQDNALKVIDTHVTDTVLPAIDQHAAEAVARAMAALSRVQQLVDSFLALIRQGE